MHLVIILVNNNLTHFFQYMYLFPFSTCFEQPSAHHQENRIVSIYHVVYVTLCRSERNFLTGVPGSHLHRVTYIIPDDVLIQFDFPDDEHWVA